MLPTTQNDVTATIETVLEQVAPELAAGGLLLLGFAAGFVHLRRIGYATVLAVPGAATLVTGLVTMAS